VGELGDVDGVHHLLLDKAELAGKLLRVNVGEAEERRLREKIMAG
jgi:hypothetical protein